MRSSRYATGVPSPLLLAVYVLATARITRLISEDRIFDKPRNAILARLPDNSSLAYGLVCTWCVSIWVAFPVATAAYWLGEHPVLFVPALALAFSHLTGLLGLIEGD